MTDTTLSPAQNIEAELIRWREIKEWRGNAARWIREMRSGTRTEASALELCETAREQIKQLEALNGQSEYE